MILEHLGLLGNCQFSALVNNWGSVVWCCLPRFDSEPVFGKLLDAEGGEFAIGPVDGRAGGQRYLDNTNILETVFETPDGRFRVLDFAPRFTLHERMFRPTQLIRIVEPLRGTPMIRTRCEPRRGWSKASPRQLRGSNHIEYEGFQAPLRLTSDITPTYLAGQPFALTGPRHLVLSWGPAVEEQLPGLCNRFLSETTRYWQRWVKHCNIPPLYQAAVIRSALALKLHCFEDTGAIVAAMTTSIPEAPGSGRNWDYRYCWLRDSYYVLGALQRLGHFEEREHFIQYLLNIAGNSPDLDLRPLYTVDGSGDLTEQVLDHWAGFEGNRPVRIGNDAALHKQHDVFGEMVLALTPVFLDDRFGEERTSAALELMLSLTRKAIAVSGEPDAGIWELRKAWEPQTFSSLMCWAAADRMARIAERFRPGDVSEFRDAADRIREDILSRAWNNERASFASTFGGKDLDASLLQMVPLRFLRHDDTRLHMTLDAIVHELSQDGWLFRYRSDDGLGSPSVAFTICTFWLIEALARLGRITEAREVMQRAQGVMSPLGLLSEDLAPDTGRMWGNFPQAYSHVGLIHAAFAASPRWSEYL
jgi:GH15 family glucan-1,4-alpha-glucosidase